MISSKSIRFHVSSNTYIIPKNMVFDQNVSINGNLITGPGVRFRKNVKVFGDAQLGKGCIVEGNLNADNIIVGSRSKIKGNTRASENVSFFQNSSAESVKSEMITIMEGCTVGYADSKRLEIIGKANILKIGPVTKVTVRAEMLISLKEDEIEDEAENKDITEIGETIEIKAEETIEIENIDEDAEDVMEIITADSKNSLSENNKSEQTKSLRTESEFAEIIDSNSETNNSLHTPPFQMEKNTKKEEPVSENLKVTNSFIPKEERCNVEILESSDFLKSAPEETRAQKTVETPFGPMTIDDPNPKAPIKRSVGAQLIIESEERKEERKEEEKEEEMKEEKEEKWVDRKSWFETREKVEKSKNSSTKKPWPQFEPQSGSESKSKTAKHNSSSAPQTSKPDTQYEKKSNAANAKGNTVNRQTNQKIIFEEIELGTKSELPKEERKQEYIISGLKKDYIIEEPEIKQEQMQEKQMQEKQTQEKQMQKKQMQERQMQEKQMQEKQMQEKQMQEKQMQERQMQERKMQERQMQERQMQEKQMQEKQGQKQNEQDMEESVNSEQSKLWYEERFKKSPEKQRKYPPYI